MIRHSEVEQNSWADIVNDTRWSFDSVWPYMRKSEYWTPPSDEHVEASGMVNVEANHGLNGSVHFGYPGFFYPQSEKWIDTLTNLGVATVDPAGGGNYGSFIAASAIDATQGNWTRSYSKTAYLDPAENRSNLVVLTGFYVTKINFDGTTATGVQFAASATGQTYTVNATSEVILSGGVIGTPHLLQLSGVGDSDLLTSFGIDVVYDLPGVGMHMTDHLSAELTFAGTSLVAYTGDDVIENTTYAAAQKQMWIDGDADSLYNSPNDAVAYVNLTTLMGDAAAATFLAACKANASATIAAYSNNTAIQAGYNLTYFGEIDTVLPSNVGAAELLLSNTGTYSSYMASSNKTVSIQAAIQHPLSRGSVKLNSTSVFDAPNIDPGYLTHPADIQVLIAAFKYALKISETAPLSTYLGTQLSPGTTMDTDADWEAWLRKSLSTEYHPASTASMLPEEAGGVVGGDCLVYGVKNLRIVDSSIVPVGLSAHMVSLAAPLPATGDSLFEIHADSLLPQTAPLYGIAERAYGIMANLDSTASSSTTSSSTSSASSTKSTSTKAKNKTKTESSSATSSAATSSATSASTSTSDATSGARAKAVTGAMGALVAVAGMAMWL